MDAKGWVLLGALLLGCASAPTPLTDSRSSAAHPDADEAVTPPPERVLADSSQSKPEGTKDAEHDAHQHEATADDAPTAAAAYSCPMHPEVTSDKPGTCPKCGMKLVPVESKEHQH